MFYHELADSPVSSLHVRNLRWSLAEVKMICRFASSLYTPEGKKITERLWEETLGEFDSAGVRGILESMKQA